MTRSLDLETEQDELFPGERRARPGIDASQRVPGKREVDLYVRTYTTLLQSSGAVPVSSLIPAHLTAASSLHAGAAEPEPDLNAFMYSAQRLPDCIVDVTDIVLGQSARGFRRAGYSGMDKWQVASAPGRRRRWRYDGNRDARGDYRLGVGSRRPHPIDRGLSDRVEQDARHCRWRSRPARARRASGCG